MKNRQHWGPIVRRLNEAQQRTLRNAISRNRHRVRRALMYVIFADNPNVKRYTPEHLLPHLTDELLTSDRLMELDIDLLLDPDSVIEDATLKWGERFWVRRLLFKMDWYRAWYVNTHNRHRATSVINYLRHRRIVRIAKRLRKQRKRTPTAKLLYRIFTFGFALAVFFILIGLYENIDDESKKQAWEFIEKALTMFLKDLLGM